MKKVLVMFCLGMFLLNHSNAQTLEKVTDDQSNAWYMYFGTYSLSDKISIHSEVQIRRSGLIEDPQQLLTRLGLNYHISKSAIITAGYGFIVTHPYGKQPVAREFNEHRIWQQLILKHAEGRFYFNHRYRQEQRWLEVQSDEKDFNYLNRSRYRFMVSVPLNNTSMVKGTWFLSLYDEIFVNFGKNVALNVFDQNRIYGAVGYQIGENSNLQLGYLNQRIQKGDAIHFENNHTLQVSFTHTLDLGGN